MCRLRELERRDLAVVNRWRNDPQLISSLGAPFRYINMDVDETWYENYLLNRNSQIRCAVVRDPEDSILGLVSLVAIDNINQSAEFHIMIGDEENQGRGIGTFAVTEMLKHAFYNLNLQRIELTVLEDNLRARHLYQKAGFVQEGVKRSAKYKNGNFVNMLLFAVLREDFEKTCNKPGGGNHNILPA